MTIDRLIAGFDRALRTVSGVHRAARRSPADAVETGDLPPADRERSAALMRVNHAGEVCAQALYQAQALTADDSRTASALSRAANEEEDHLAWCATRISELGGRTSALAPVWYAGSFAIGALAGLSGDRWSLAFLAETERQVEAHLEGHLARLPEADRASREIVRVMRDDEASHRDTALRLGAAEMPAPLRGAMRLTARVLTSVAYRI